MYYQTRCAIKNEAERGKRNKNKHAHLSSHVLQTQKLACKQPMNQCIKQITGLVAVMQSHWKTENTKPVCENTGKCNISYQYPLSIKTDSWVLACEQPMNQCIWGGLVLSSVEHLVQSTHVTVTKPSWLSADARSRWQRAKTMCEWLSAWVRQKDQVSDGRLTARWWRISGELIELIIITNLSFWCSVYAASAFSRKCPSTNSWKRNIEQGTAQAMEVREKPKTEQRHRAGTAKTHMRQEQDRENTWELCIKTHTHQHKWPPSARNARNETKKTPACMAQTNAQHKQYTRRCILGLGLGIVW